MRTFVSLVLFSLTFSLTVFPLQPLSVSAQPQGNHMRPRPMASPHRAGGPHRPKDGFTPQKFRKELQTFITTEAGFSPQESKAFFPLFFEMKATLRNLHHKKIKALRVAASNAHLSEKDYNRILDQVASFEKQKEKVERDQLSRLRRLVGAKKLLKALDADERFGRRMFRSMTGDKASHSDHRAAQQKGRSSGNR